MNAQEFAHVWEQGWNSHDLDVIMSHYSEGIVFRSLKAAALVGQGEVVGKPALQSYWAAALEQQPNLKFQVQDVFVGYQMMVISYRNHRDVLAIETLHFDNDGKIFLAAACHKQI